jgi:hypothetical protein
VACFERALAEGIPILDANFLSKITRKEAEGIFRSSNGVEIPLLDRRIENMHQAGEVLLEKYDGLFFNLLKKVDFDAIKIVRQVVEDFTSFRDIHELDGEQIYILKRAQIVAFDIGYLRSSATHQISNTNLLTAFADYKIPQILRMFGILEYSAELAKRVDNYELILSGSREEIEIRSASIWCVELMKQKMPQYMAGQIDNAIWGLSQDWSDLTKPYHRAYSIYY